MDISEIKLDKIYFIRGEFVQQNGKAIPFESCRLEEDLNEEDNDNDNDSKE